MRKLMSIVAVAAALTFAFAAGFSSSASAQTEDGPGRGPGRGGAGPEHPVMHQVAEACPCAGPEGAGWADHAAYVECVTAKVADLVANAGLGQAVADKIVARAEQSQIGEPGYECPTRPEGPRGRGRGRHGPCPTAEPTAEPTVEP